MGRSTQKKKATEKEHVASDLASEKSAGGKKHAKVPMDKKVRSHGRFPGETPLTGEDRPAKRPGGKAKGQPGRTNDPQREGATPVSRKR
jgi:hypothetical protein